MVGIYKITNLKTGEFYIGQSNNIEKRWRDHFCKGYGAMHSARFQEAIDSLGRDGFAFTVIEECDVSDLADRERYWIRELTPAYNTITPGHVVSPETRAKISGALTGKKPSPEIVELRRKAILERHKTIPQTNAGHRKKVGIETAEGVMEFESVKAAASYLEVRPSTVSAALKRGIRCKKHKVWYVV